MRPFFTGGVCMVVYFHRRVFKGCLEDLFISEIMI